MQGAESRLAQALDNMRLSTPAQRFAGRYQLLSERVKGGQALVQVRNHLLCTRKLRDIPCDTELSFACSAVSARFVTGATQVRVPTVP